MNADVEFGEIVRGHIVYKAADGRVLPGTTTITGQLNKPALIGWAVKVTKQGLDHRAIAEESRRVGTLAHTMVQCHLMGTEPDLQDYSPRQVGLAENAVLKLFNYIEQNDLKPALVEKPLVSQKFGYGGTIDHFGLRRGTLALVDWKTGSGVYREHYYQVAAYWNLLVENGYQADEVWVVRLGREESDQYEEHCIDHLEEWFEGFLHLLHFYQTDQKLK